MKTISILIISFLITTAAIAQDIIILKNGAEIKGRVTEISIEQVKMKRADNPNGPVYAISKEDVFMIRYENGDKEMFNGDKKAPQTVVIAPAPAPAPVKTEEDEEFEPRLKYNGPRFGVTYIGDGVVADKMQSMGYNPLYTQFGWQFETRIWSVKNGPTGVVEFVPLVAGLDKGNFIPNFSLLLGVRSKEGYEVGVGPNAVLDLTGEGGSSFGLVMAGGASIKRGKVIFPVNLAVVPSVKKSVTVPVYDANTNLMVNKTTNVDMGIRVSLLIGFNTRTR